MTCEDTMPRTEKQRDLKTGKKLTDGKTWSTTYKKQEIQNSGN